METVQIKITKMGCNACVNNVTRALRELNGVDVVNVKIGEATVQRDKSKVSDDEIIAALEAAGYPSSWDTSGTAGKDETGR